MRVINHRRMVHSSPLEWGHKALGCSQEWRAGIQCSVRQEIRSWFITLKMNNRFVILSPEYHKENEGCKCDSSVLWWPFMLGTSVSTSQSKGSVASCCRSCLPPYGRSTGGVSAHPVLRDTNQSWVCPGNRCLVTLQWFLLSTLLLSSRHEKCLVRSCYSRSAAQVLHTSLYLESFSHMKSIFLV